MSGQSQAHPGEAPGGVADEACFNRRNDYWLLEAGLGEHPCMIVTGDLREFSIGRIAHRKLAGGDAEICAMDHDFRAFDQAAQARTGHQVLEAVDDIGLLEPSRLVCVCPTTAS